MWDQVSDGTYATEISGLPFGAGILCPKCGTKVRESHCVGTVFADESREGIAGWLYMHPCGAKLLITND